jgi:RHS repeat-associated protein
MTKPNGEIVWSATYDAMGRVDQILVDEVAQPLRMQGQYWDEEIALCYNRHRYFDPQICSFISQDPLGLAAGENVYAYAPNVWGWVDPMGLCEEQAKVHVAYHKNKPVGHNVIGIEMPNEKTRWFDLVMTESPGGAKGLVKGGQETLLREQSKISKRYRISTREVDLDSAKEMLSKAEELKSSGTGPYQLLSNSCTSTVADVLKAGGAKPAWWAKTPSLIYKWF